ncbi:MAG: DUF7144 family membrane protein [Trebonia sp.]
MSDMNDRPAQEPRSGATAGQTTAAAQDASRSDTGATADTARGYVPRPAPGYDDVNDTYREPRGAVIGLTMLAAVFMMVTGVIGFFEGLAAIIRGSFFVTLPNYAFSLSAVGWGWVHLILGALIFVAGGALLADQTWARITGVVLAAFIMVANFVYLPYYPVWAIVLIALNAFVIWALLTPRRY